MKNISESHKSNQIQLKTGMITVWIMKTAGTWIEVFYLGFTKPQRASEGKKPQRIIPNEFTRE